MFLWHIVQFCLVILVGLFIVTQILIPAVTSKPMFWFFKKPDTDLLNAERELSDIDVKEKVNKVKDEIKNRARDLTRKGKRSR